MDKPLLIWEDLPYKEKCAIKVMCEESFEWFVRIFFELMQAQRFLMNWHHALEVEFAEKVIRGEIKRLIINVAPGSTKTEIWSIHLPAWGIINSYGKDSTRWLPVSYSESLVVENSSRVRDIVMSEPFQEMWPMELNREKRAKHNWEFRDEEGKVHNMYGTSLGGQLTGRRAGFMSDGFSGALILDDPSPPRNDFSPKATETANRSLNQVVRSRLATDSVPIIMVQQRIGVRDTTYYCLSGKTPDTYELVTIPALIDRTFVESLPDKIKERCIGDTKFEDERVSYWPVKEPTTTLLSMEESDAYTFAAQYQQNPSEALAEGLLLKKELERMVKEGRYCHVAVEPALPVHTYWDLGINDYMVILLIQVFGKEIRIVGSYANHNAGMEHYINYLHEYRDTHQVRYGTHYAPHDIQVRELSSGQDRKTIAQRMGIRFKMVPRCKMKSQAINAVKSLMPRIWVSKVCSEEDPIKHSLWDALGKIGRGWDATNEVFTDQIGPKWATNYFDALAQMALIHSDKQPDADQWLPALGSIGVPDDSDGSWLGL